MLIMTAYLDGIKRLPSHEGSGLKWSFALTTGHVKRLPSHEGSGLKSLAFATNSSNIIVSPRMRGVD